MTIPPDAIAETEPATPRRRGPLRMTAVFAATLLVAGAAAYLGTRGDGSGSSRPELALRAGASGISGATPDSATAGGARSSLAINANIHYVVDGSLPTLPAEARVSELEAPEVDAARVSKWAQVLHLDAEVGPQPEDVAPTGWQAIGSDGTLSVSGDPSMMYFNYQHGTVQDGGAEPGSGSTGSSAAGMRTSAGSASTDGLSVADPDACVSSSISPDGKAISVPCGPIVDSPSGRPANLPSSADAGRIGEQALRDLGVLVGEWEFETRDGGSVAVSSSCAPDSPCAPPVDDAYTVSREVVAHRLLDGHRVDGLDWTVEVGDAGTIASVSGVLGIPVAVADYPLITLDAARQSLDDGTRYGSPVPAVGAPEPAIAASPCPDAAVCAAPTTSAPMPICPDSCPVADVTITISGVSLGTQRWTGGDAQSPTMYLVPTYHFTGHDASGADWSTDVLALTADTLAAKD